MILVAAFYADVPEKPSRAGEYLAFALASQKALQRTTPDSRYVLLTDRATAPKFDATLECLCIAEPGYPLMQQVIRAQLAFLKIASAELIVLPDVDCVTNQNICRAIPTDVGLAITHKGEKRRHRIVNLAMVRDRELGIRFFQKALAIQEAFPADHQDWWGDQDAWGLALGIPVDGFDEPEQVGLARGGENIFIAQLDGKPVHIYPSETHNCTMTNAGHIGEVQRKALMVHFKGPRKEHLAQFMLERFRV